jgi:hypothetical protein
VNITPDDGQTNCPKYVEFNFQNKFEKLVHLVGFIIRKFVTMHGRMNAKVFFIRRIQPLSSFLNSSCMFQWTNYGHGATNTKSQ